MINQIIKTRLEHYPIHTPDEEENALKEILQDMALYALSTTDFFSKALFQGGTALRILYGLPRFSEDLDFILQQPNKHFRWEKYSDQIQKTLLLYDMHPEIADRSNENNAIQKLFLKDDSIGKVLHFNVDFQNRKKLFIKLEIDTNPPLGSTEVMRYLDFPIDYAVATQDLSSNFAGKCHALLCRQYVKGRDWFDFSWYITKKTAINFTFLQNALFQAGPWAGHAMAVDKEWLMRALEDKIKIIDWQAVSQEVRRFLTERDRAGLNVWGVDFFLHKLEQLGEYL